MIRQRVLRCSQEPWASQCVENARRENGNTRAISDRFRVVLGGDGRFILINTFTWTMSPQRGRYWVRISNTLE